MWTNFSEVAKNRFENITTKMGPVGHTRSHIHITIVKAKPPILLYISVRLQKQRRMHNREANQEHAQIPVLMRAPS